MGSLLSPLIHRYLFLFTLGIAFCSLPFSRFTLSIGLIAFSINWVLEGDWHSKINRLKSNISLFLFLLIYLFLLFGMLYTEDLHSGIRELQQKIPLLIIPIVIATSKPTSEKEFFYIILSFCVAVTVSSFYSVYLFFGNYINGGSNVREISPFISHIRLGLMVNLALFLSLYYGFRFPEFIKTNKKLFFFGNALWLAFFLFILQSLTGIIIFFLTILILTIYLLFRYKKTHFRIIITTLMFAFTIILTYYIFDKANKFFTRNEIQTDSLPTHTVNGNKYYHIIENQQYENGYLVWINLSYIELEEQWNRISNLPYLGKDKMGQTLRLTLIRYLTSKGLPKDSLGISKLDEVDIQLIESGATSVIFREHKFGLYPRLYQLFWEIDQYNMFRKISGSPLIQRMVYIRAAVYIIKQNFWVGVGTGDLTKSFNDYYEKNEPNLKPSYWFLSHNQFLTQWVSLGLFGFFVFLIGWFSPFIIEKKYTELISITFMLIITLSMLNEDTLETHIGVSLASLFYSLFFFGREKKSNIVYENVRE